VANIEETRFEKRLESFTLAVVDAGGEPRELHLAVEIHLAEEDGIRVTVFHGTEHALIPLNDSQARELAMWLVEKVGLPPGWEFRGGRLTGG